MAEMSKLDIGTQLDEYLAASDRFHAVNEKIQAEREVYYKRAELRAFKSFQGDTGRIVDAIKDQVLTFIYVSKILAGNAPEPADREIWERRREEVKQAIISNEKLIEKRPDDEELKKNTQELRELAAEPLPLLYDATYSPAGLRKRINENFAMYFDFLTKADPEAYADLQVYIDDAIEHRDEIEPMGEISKKEAAFQISQYLKLPQAKHTNSLAHKLTTRIKEPAQLDFNGKGTILSKDFRLYIEGYDKLANGANTSAVKFFDAAVMTCSRNRDALARIPLIDYMELRGLKDEKEARKQIKSDMELLKAIKFDYKGTGKSRGDWLSLSLYGGRAGIYKGIIEFMFSRDFYASIPENQFMFIPKEYFSTKDKYNPHTAYFIRRIAEHKRMNLGKANENIIGVDTLISSSPTFPKYEDVYYQFTQKILEPFERDMDAIGSIKWHYAEGQPDNYNDFTISSVVITWVDYPEVKKLLENKKGRGKEKKQPKKRAEKGG